MNMHIDKQIFHKSNILIKFNVNFTVYTDFSNSYKLTKKQKNNMKQVKKSSR